MPYFTDNQSQQWPINISGEHIQQAATRLELNLQNSAETINWLEDNCILFADLLFLICQADIKARRTPRGEFQQLVWTHQGDAFKAFLLALCEVNPKQEKYILERLSCNSSLGTSPVRIATVAEKYILERLSCNRWQQ